MIFFTHCYTLVVNQSKQPLPTNTEEVTISPSDLLSEFERDGDVVEVIRLEVVQLLGDEEGIEVVDGGS